MSFCCISKGNTYFFNNAAKLLKIFIFGGIFFAMSVAFCTFAFKRFFI